MKVDLWFVILLCDDLYGDHHALFFRLQLCPRQSGPAAGHQVPDQVPQHVQQIHQNWDRSLLAARLAPGQSRVEEGEVVSGEG